MGGVFDMPWKSPIHRPWNEAVSKEHARQKAREEYRTDAYAYMYNMAEWRHPKIGIRAMRLKMEPGCRDCRSRGVVTAAQEVDHIVPHKGDMSLFIDIDNTQSLCKSCHSTKTAMEMR